MSCPRGSYRIPTRRQLYNHRSTAIALTDFSLIELDRSDFDIESAAHTNLLCCSSRRGVLIMLGIVDLVARFQGFGAGERTRNLHYNRNLTKARNTMRLLLKGYLLIRTARGI